MDQPPFLSGQLLLAMPGIGDPRFEKAVIAMCVHDENGALGIGLGRIVPRITFHDLLRQLDIEPGVAPDVPIHLGGPVEPQRGFILHSPDWGGQESVHVAGRWVLSATLDILRAIAEGRGPTRWSGNSAATAGSQPRAATNSSTSATSKTAGPPPSEARAWIRGSSRRIS